jgi:hypothetical protein
MKNEMDILLDDEFWTIKRFGPRYYTAHRKTDGEHRIYYSREALERDFSITKKETESAKKVQLQEASSA